MWFVCVLCVFACGEFVVSLWCVVCVFVVCVYVYGKVCSLWRLCAGCVWLVCLECVCLCVWGV